jgi:putative membrane protein
MSFEGYQTLKSLHLIFMVSWFAGLFYIVRLFIYHLEANERDEASAKVLKDQFELMEYRLWWIITTPAMVLTVVFGTWMLVVNPALLKLPWMHIKLAFVVLLLVYHFVCQRTMHRFKSGTFSWTSNGLRMWNEVATLVLVAVVFLVEMQGTLNWLKGTVGFFAVAIGLMMGIQLYKRLRRKA